MNYTEIYQRYFTHIENYIKSRTNQSSNAFDYAQQTFLRLYEKQDSYPNLTIQNAIYVLFKIANRILIDEHRRKKLDTVNIDNTMFTISDKNIVQDKVELNNVLNKALDTLKPQVKKVFELFYYENYKIHEIAKMIGVTENYIKQILFRNKKKLREIIEHEYK